MTTQRIRIGDLLLQKGFISDTQLQTAITEQQRSGEKLGAILINLGFIDEITLLNTLANQLQIPFIDLDNYPYKTAIAQLLPEIQARRFRCLVLTEEENHFLIGMADPQELSAIDTLSRLLKKPLQFALIQENILLKVFDRVYDRDADIKRYAEALSIEVSDTGAFNLADLNNIDNQTDAPVVKLLQSLLEEALRLQASDIHIEPEKTLVRLRLRIDGLLHERIVNEPHIAAPLTQRLKLMAGLNITEKRLPQDGRFSIKTRKENIEIRLSTMPVQQGESIVMRILQSSRANLPLTDLGMPEEMLTLLRKAVARPHGMVLVTGPTGSGKTTTLYSLLNELNTPEKKIITVEDPVEYRIPRINQVQINPKIDLDFARVLRSALRQDPDIMLVGEIRDTESAQIAMRAAMTGHLVLASLHTNDALSSTLRLMDIAVEPYLVSAALRVVVAQRLLRKICDHCRGPYQPNLAELQWIADHYPTQHFIFEIGHGCLHCQQTGYRGRIGVYELLLLRPNMLDALRTQDISAFQAMVVADKTRKTLINHALLLAQNHQTSISEVIRVIETIDDVIAS